MQFHRRVKAMQKLRRLLDTRSDGDTGSTSTEDISTNKDDENMDAPKDPNRGSFTSSVCPFQPSTLLSVLLPLVEHLLLSPSFIKKDHLTLMQEAALTLGSIARHLKWPPYYQLVRKLLRILHQNKEEKEKMVIMALCHVLDAFHFDMSVSKMVIDLATADVSGTPEGTAEGTAEAEEDHDQAVDKDEKPGKEEEGGDRSGSNNIASTVVRTLLPWIEQFLVKTTTITKGAHLSLSLSAIFITAPTMMMMSILTSASLLRALSIHILLTFSCLHYLTIHYS